MKAYTSTTPEDVCENLLAYVDQEFPGAMSRRVFVYDEGFASLRLRRFWWPIWTREEMFMHSSIDEYLEVIPTPVWLVEDENRVTQ